MNGEITRSYLEGSNLLSGLIGSDITALARLSKKSTIQGGSDNSLFCEKKAIAVYATHCDDLSSVHFSVYS